MEEKLLDFLTDDNPWKFGECELQRLIRECLIDNELLELLDEICRIILKNDDWHVIYKATIIIKYLCNKDPERVSKILAEKINFLKSLKNYSHIDKYGKDRGENVRNNIEQLIDFIEIQEKLKGQRVTDMISFNKNGLDSAVDKLQQTLSSIKNIKSENSLKKVKSDIAGFNKFLSGPITPERYLGLDKNLQIDGFIYGKILESLVDTFDDNWPIINNNLDPDIERLIIVKGATFPIFHEILIVLTDALKRASNKKTIDSICILLEKLIKSNLVLSVLIDVCKLNEKSAIEREEMENKWQTALQILVSLPNRIANKLEGKISDCFRPEIYANIISVNVVAAISFLNLGQIKSDVKCDKKMLSMMISKAVIVLGAHRLDSLIDIMLELCSENPNNIQYFINDILSHIEKAAIEPIAVSFLRHSKSRLRIENVFGNLLGNANWKHVFTVKIPLMSYYNDDNLIKNLIGYLFTWSTDQRVLIDLLIRLLDIWGDRSAMNHTSLEQHEYITKLILISVRKVKGVLGIDEKNNARRLLFAGTSAHLESTRNELRAIGMITGEIVIEMLKDSNDAPKLKYSYDGMPEEAKKVVEKLKNLENDKNETNDSDNEKRNTILGDIIFESFVDKKIHELRIKCGIILDKDGSKDFLESKSREKTEPKILKAVTNEISDTKSSTPNDGDDLDSDDDLVPYDMSNDTAISEKHRPTYLRDLKENLLNSDSNADPDIFSESLKISEQLILSQLPNDDSSFGIELLEILMTLKEISYVEKFQLLKFKACVAIVIVYPKDSAKYLCNEFHTEISAYTIKDRLFILDVLGESARKLSKIEIKEQIDEKAKSPKNKKKLAVERVSLTIDRSNSKKYETLYDDDFEVLPIINENSTDWEEIVKKRIESKTRRFAHGSKKPATTMNKFNDVAASFFYPLLYGFRRKGTCMHDTPKSFQDQENILLVNYLKTLSAIMISAENCVIVPKMGKEILDLAWALRYHNEAKVRLSVIENIASVVITLPKNGLVAELLELILEFRAWLTDVSDDGIRGDPDSKCRNMGKNVVALIDSIFHSAINEL